MPGFAAGGYFQIQDDYTLFKKVIRKKASWKTKDIMRLVRRLLNEQMTGEEK